MSSSLSLMSFHLWEDWAKAIQNKTEMRDGAIRKEGRNSHSFRWHDFRDPATAKKQSENIIRKQHSEKWTIIRERRLSIRPEIISFKNPLTIAPKDIRSNQRHECRPTWWHSNEKSQEHNKTWKMRFGKMRHMFTGRPNEITSQMSIQF